MGLAAYGAVPLVVGALVLAGVVPGDGTVDRTALRRHLVLWDPWWILGGVLFLATAWLTGHRRALA